MKQLLIICIILLFLPSCFTIDESESLLTDEEKIDIVYKVIDKRLKYYDRRGEDKIYSAIRDLKWEIQSEIK